MGESWDEWYGRLVKFTTGEGHCEVPQAHDEDGYKLGSWVRNQRARRYLLTSEKRSKLEILNGWTWSPLDNKWDEAFKVLEKYSKKFPNGIIPLKFQTEDGFKLGVWCQTQRMERDLMSIQRSERLAGVNGWIWNTKKGAWNIGFYELSEYVKLNEATQIKQSLRTSSGYKLGNWVIQQRMSKDTLSEDKIYNLESITGWIWNTREDAWDHGFACLNKYINVNGNSLITHTYITDENFKLGSWVQVQRVSRNSMPPKRKNKLDAIPEWVWIVADASWDLGYESLKRFLKKNQISNLKNKTLDDYGYKLGSWVDRQKTSRNKKTLSLERIQKLEAIPSWIWAKKLTK